MGGAVVSIPFLLWILPAKEAVPLSNTLALTRDSFLIKDALLGIKHKLVFPLIIGSFIGSVIGYYYLGQLSNVVLIRLAGGAIILFEIIYWRYVHRRSLDKIQVDVRGNAAEKIVQPNHPFEKLNLGFLARSCVESFLPQKWGHVLAGLFSGIMTGTIGMGGPILAIYLRQVITDSLVIRSTLIAFFTVNSLLQVLLMLYNGILRIEYVLIALVCFPFVAFGSRMARMEVEKMEREGYRFGLSALIIVAALTLIFRSF